jgi:hypothetical protein
LSSTGCLMRVSVSLSGRLFHSDKRADRPGHLVE